MADDPSPDRAPRGAGFKARTALRALVDLGELPGYRLAVRGQYEDHYRRLGLAGAKARAEAMRPLVARVLEALDLPDDGWLLDLGAGDGVVALAAARLRPAMSVLGVDASEAAVALAREVAAAEGLRNASFVVGDAEAPPDAHFERICAMSVFDLLPDKRGALAAWRRVALPRGRLVIADGFTLRGPGTLGAGAASHAAFGQAARLARWRVVRRDDLTPLVRKLAQQGAWPWTEYLRDGFRYELVSLDAI